MQFWRYEYFGNLLTRLHHMTSKQNLVNYTKIKNENQSESRFNISEKAGKWKSKCSHGGDSDVRRLLLNIAYI